MGKPEAGDLEPIVLDEPLFEGGGTVLEALKARATSRFISDRRISKQVLSDLLWAAQGVNRVHGPFGVPGRTAGSAQRAPYTRLGNHRGPH